MSRITNQLAEDIAMSMIAKKVSKLRELEASISEKVRNEVLKDIPESVINFFKENPTYTYKTSSVQLVGNGCNREYVSVDYIPSPNGNTIYKNVSPEFGKEIIKLINKKDKIDSDIYTLRRSIENALKNLRTFKNVRENFPEASEFLPKDDKPTFPALNLDIIRQQLV